MSSSSSSSSDGNGESARTDIGSVIDVTPIRQKNKLTGPFKSGSFGQLVRFDANRGITETSREYMAERTEVQLRSVASVANRDISSIRDTVLHMGNVMAKNTGDRITAVTNQMDSDESAEDEG